MSTEATNKMLDDLSLFHNPEPICPHCGSEYRDAWELNFEGSSDETGVDCGSCEKPYTIIRDITVSYTTKI